MVLPPLPAVIAFEEFLKELPPDYAEQAREFKAFTRSHKVKTPAQLLQIVMLYCGLDQALRSTAGTFALLQERITDTAIHARLKACGPWLRALLHTMLPGDRDRNGVDVLPAAGGGRLFAARARRTGNRLSGTFGLGLGEPDAA